MSKRSKFSAGFTLIEIILVILIIGIAAQIGIPRVFRTRQNVTIDFISRLNNLVQAGIQAAIDSGEMHKVLFSLRAKQVELVSTVSNKTSMKIKMANEIALQDFFINGINQFKAMAEKDSAFFFINTEGTAQNVKLILVDESKQPLIKSEFVLNPFTGRFLRV